MSLNDEVKVIRNGRSTSQISIYNYPEHLNPFYEDEQHKRIRFWQYNKKLKGDERRNSFSISNLKDMWAFKSFRLKKKSSTLGINKTSESPPAMRREIYKSPEDEYVPFERNVMYRSSLQNMHNFQNDSNDFAIDFARNGSYRRTLHNVPNDRPKILGSPQSNRYAFDCGGKRNEYATEGIRNNSNKRELSMLSLSSTNPFDIDENCERTLSKIKRKKRRAPQPPVMVVINNTVDTNREDLKSSQSPIVTEKMFEIESDLSISNITADIENLVNLSSYDDIEGNNTIAMNSNSKQSTRKEGTEDIDKRISTKLPSEDVLSEQGITNQLENKTAKKEQFEDKAVDKQLNNSYEVKSNLEIPDNVSMVPSDNKNLLINESIKNEIVTDETINEPIKNSTNLVSSNPKNEYKLQHLSKDREEVDNEHLGWNISLYVKDIQNAGMNKIYDSTEKVCAEIMFEEKPLKIVESDDTIGLSEMTIQNTDSNKLKNTNENINKPDISIYGLKPKSHLEWKQSTLAPLGFVPPNKRKSVKEIIESINRSQKLLQTPLSKNHYCSNVVEQDDLSKNGAINKKCNIIYDDQNDSTKINNSEFFKKCEIKKEFYDFRESSPTISNLDWNPVPKPKRIKNFTN